MAQQVEYYINDILQGYNPGVPDPATKIILSDEATLGFKDKVDRTTCLFGVITAVTTDEEDSQIYEDYLACHPEVTLIKNDAGFFLINEDGKYITKD